MANSLLDRIKKVTNNDYASELGKSKVLIEKELVTTTVPAINIALSGRIDGGFSSGITVACGESKSFKSLLSLFCAKCYMDKYEDSLMIFFDSEMGSSIDYFDSLGIDTSRVLHVPITNVEDLKFQIVAQLQEIKRGDHCVIVIDSIGNLASKKEVSDAVEQKAVADMSRAKSLKSLCRIITPELNLKDIPLFMVNHTIKTMDFIPQTVMTGGCLFSDVTIKTKDGDTKISMVKVGDEVLSSDGEYHKVDVVWTPETLEHGHTECLEITFEDGHTVKCSEGHKFKIDGEWVESKNLKVGDDVVSLDGVMKITSITPVGTHDVYDICVRDTHDYVLSNGVITHNSGIMYSADTVINITRSQEKKGSDLIGYNFNMNVMKSRHSREKAKIPLTVLFEGGINRWSGLLEMAVASGDVIKPSNGWYSRVDEDGVVEDKKFREADTNTAEFWAPILKKEHFKTWVTKTFKVASSKLVEDSVDEQFVPSTEFTEE